MQPDEKPEVSEETKTAMRNLASGITATEGTENTTLNSDENDPDNESSRSVTHRSFSMESEMSSWQQIAVSQTK